MFRQFSLDSTEIMRPLIETEFGDERMINGYFILMPEEESYAKILSSLGIQL